MSPCQGLPGRSVPSVLSLDKAPAPLQTEVTADTEGVGIVTLSRLLHEAGLSVP